MNIDQEHLGPPMRVDPPQTRGARSCNFVLLQFFRRKTYDLSVYMNRSTLFQSPCPSILTPLSRSSKSITATTRVGGPETFWEDWRAGGPKKMSQGSKSLRFCKSCFLRLEVQDRFQGPDPLCPQTLGGNSCNSVTYCCFGPIFRTTVWFFDQIDMDWWTPSDRPCMVTSMLNWSQNYNILSKTCVVIFAAQCQLACPAQPGVSGSRPGPDQARIVATPPPLKARI